MPAPTTIVHDLPVRLRLRWAPPVGPQSRMGEALERLRMGSHRILPVVDAGSLVGVVRDATLARALLERDDAGHAALRAAPVREWMEPAPATICPDLDTLRVLDLLETHPDGALIVCEPDGAYLGIVAASDLVADLTRPAYLPVIGGMATMTGVYLTTGTVSAGQRWSALAVTGAALFGLQFGLLALIGLLRPFLPMVPAEWAPLVGVAGGALYVGTFLALVRLSPAAGFHAAEHQVVHALERHEPLLVPVVRQMPRVHPRCGTQFLAAGVLLGMGAPLSPWLGSAAYALSGLVALAYWRPLGAWLQRHVTTRPASDRQIETAIQAARALQEALLRPSFTPTRPWERLWRLGLAPVALGFALAALAVALLGWLHPPLGAWLRPLWNELLIL